MKKIISFFLVLILILVVAVSALAATTPDKEKPPSFFHYLATLFKNIFVPSDHYFYDKVAELNNNVNKKLGGVAQLYHVIENFFKSLNMPDAEAELAFSLPDNFYFDGYKGTSINIFTMAKPFIRLLKDVFNVGICILTSVACYHKLRGFFNESEG